MPSIKLYIIRHLDKRNELKSDYLFGLIVCECSAFSPFKQVLSKNLGIGNMLFPMPKNYSSSKYSPYSGISNGLSPVPPISI